MGIVKRSMSVLVPLCAALAAFAPASVQSGRADTPHLLHVELGGVINPIKARYIKRALDQAQRDGSSLVLLSIDTPGGLVPSMQDIVSAITNCKIPVVGVVEPRTAQATSAGALILLATDVAAMLPDTRVGAAHPVGAGQPLPGAMEKKATNSLASLAKSLAKRRGRSAKAAEAMVRKSVSYTAQEAHHKKLVELIVTGRDDLLARLDGYELAFPDRTTKLATRGASWVDVKLSAAERLLDAVADPTLASILLSIGVLGIVYELSAPGIGLGGIVGVTSLLMALLGLSVMPVRLAGVLLLVAGLLAIALEIKTTAHGLLGLGGLGSIVAGALVLIDETRYFGALQAIEWGVFVPVVSVLSVTVLGIAAAAARSQRPSPRTGIEALPGKRGIVRDPIVQANPGLTGSVWVDGARWQATSEDDLAVGEAVVVVEVLTHPTRLRVQRLGKGES